GEFLTVVALHHSNQSSSDIDTDSTLATETVAAGGAGGFDSAAARFGSGGAHVLHRYSPSTTRRSSRDMLESHRSQQKVSLSSSMSVASVTASGSGRVETTASASDSGEAAGCTASVMP